MTRDRRVQPWPPRIREATLPHDETYFEALPIISAASRARLQPHRVTAARWALRCPVCRQPSATILALPGGVVAECRYGCSPAAIRQILEGFAE
jgi:hypothetical protein